MTHAMNRLRRWRSSDDRELRRLVEGNASVGYASAVLGRSEEAVRYRMKSLGLSSRKRGARR